MPLIVDAIAGFGGEVVFLSIIARRLMRSKVSLLLAGAPDHALPGRICLGLAFAYS